jgi:hypothetical protein
MVEQGAILVVYRQGGNARKRRGGAGLGLAITRRLVEMHHGTIELFSQLGHGSTFMVTLPRADSIDTGDRPSGDNQRPSFFSVTDARERARYASMPDVRVPRPPRTPRTSDPEGGSP